MTRNSADDVNAFWLPSGNRIVFNREDAKDLEIHSIRPDGTGIAAIDREHTSRTTSSVDTFRA